MYHDLLPQLRQAYDRAVRERDAKSKAPWKLQERARFLALLLAEGKRSFLEIGAGTGQDSLFFQENGLQVTATDLSEENVRRCRRKGLCAHVADFAQLDLPEAPFDAVYAINCLLHVPRADLPTILEGIRALLRPGGLFYWGQYGGRDEEGVYQGDHYQPKRFFSFLADDGIQVVAQSHFDLVRWQHVPLEDEADLHFQSLTLRRRNRATSPGGLR